MAYSLKYERPESRKTDTFTWDIQNEGGDVHPSNQVDITLAATPLTGYPVGNAKWTDADTSDDVITSGIPHIVGGASGVIAIGMQDGKVGDQIKGATIVERYRCKLASSVTPITLGS